MKGRMTEYGFEWGPVTVERHIEHKGMVIFGVRTKYKDLDVYVSPSGRSVRVFDRVTRMEWKEKPE